MKLHTYLKNARQTQGLRLQDVADRAGGNICLSHVSNLEKGVSRNPSPHILHALSIALKLDYLELMRLAGHIKTTTPKKRK